MPSLALFATSPSFLSAALSAASPHMPLQLAMPTAAPALADWSLAAAPPSADAGPPENESEEGEIVVEGEYGPPPGDPAEQINAQTYRLAQAVDSAVIEPVAHAYRDGVPEPIRDGLGNVVKNLGEPSNALNFLLQGKVGKAFETLGRLAINSTLGVGGLFDVAGKPGIGLPYRRNGFANTLGYYGVGPGPYLYVPVTGATTVRDLAGRTLDQLLLPIAVGKPFNRFEYGVSYFIINGLDQRLEFDEELAKIEASDDPYGVRRDTYLAQRRRDIAALKGEVLPEDETVVEPGGATVVEPTSPEADTPVEAPTDPEPPADPEALLITRPR